MKSFLKISQLFLFVFLSVYIYAQSSIFDTRITLHVANSSIESVIQQIHTKYPSVNFSYSPELLESERKVTLDFNNTPLQEVLNTLFLKSDIEYLQVNNTIALRKRSKPVSGITSSKAEPTGQINNDSESPPEADNTMNKSIEGGEKLIVTGTVTDEDGNTLPGAAVLIKEGNLGVVTNTEGKYRIDLSKYEYPVLVFQFIGKEDAEVIVNNLSEIDVTLESAMHVLDEVVFIGYGAQRKKDIVGSIASINAEELTQSVPASVDQMLEGKVPGLVVSSTSAEPGAKTEVRVRGVSSIDAVNSPLYIVDGVPYTTEIELELYDGFNMNPLANLNPEDIESISVLKDAAATAIYGANASNGVILITTKKGQKGHANVNFSSKVGVSNRINNSYERLNTPEYVELMTEALMNTGLTEEEARQKAGRTDVDVNWPGLLYRSGLMQSYNLSVSGGSETFKYYTSIGHTGQNGIVKGNDLNKTSLRINLSHKIGNNIELSYNISPTFMDKDNFVLLQESNEILPNVPVYDENGDYNPEIEDHPLAILDQNEDNDKSYRLVGGVNASLTFLKNFTFDVKYGIDLYNNNGRTHYSMLNQTGATYGGLGSRVSTQNMKWYTNGLLRYNKVFNEVHTIDWLVSAEAERTTLNIVSARASNFPNDKMRELSAASVYEYAGSRKSEQALLSYFTRLNYNYDSRYYLTASIRNDASSIFGGDVKSSVKGALGVSWVISNESFFSSADSWLPLLKLRGSYGTAGNSRIGTYASRGIYTYNGNAYNNNSGLGPLYAANPDLSWETSHIFNLGLDFHLRKFFSGTVEGYLKNNNNLLTSTAVSQTTGFSRSTQNLGDSQNKGVELTLRFDWINNREFQWFTESNVSFEKSIYTKLYHGNGRDLSTKIILEGESVNNFYLIRWAGVNPNNGEALYYDVNGNITNEYDRDNRVVIGSALPDYYGSVTNTFRYKGFTLRVYTTFTEGNLVYNSQRAQGETDGEELGTINQNKSQLDRWQNPGDITNVPKIVYQNESRSADPSTRFLEDGSHINIKNISLSYGFNKKVCSALKMKSWVISAMVDNAFVFSGLKSISSSAGRLSTYYPDVRTYMVTMNIGF